MPVWTDRARESRHVSPSGLRGVNNSSPQAQGLLLWLPGPAFDQRVRARYLTRSRSVQPTWTLRGAGLGVAGLRDGLWWRASGSASQYMTFPAAFRSSTLFVAVQFIPDNAADTGAIAQVSGLTNGSGSGGPMFPWRHTNSTFTASWAWFNGGWSAAQVSDGVGYPYTYGPPAGTRISSAFAALSATEKRVYEQGVHWHTSTDNRDLALSNQTTLELGSVSTSYVAGYIRDFRVYDALRVPDVDLLAELIANDPWDLADAGDRTYFIPAAAGGPTTHTITPSGGVAFAGSGVYQYARTHDVSGGVQIAGSAAIKATRIHDVSGGVQFAGTSTFNVSRDIVPDGGVQLGGSAAQVNTRVHDVSGGLSFSGAAGMQATRVLSPSGGLSLGGTGNFTGVEAGLTIVPSGGIQFGGGASGTLWPDNLAYGGFAHRVARKVADDVTDDVTDLHRRYDD